ncbi:MAG: signal peptidase I [Gorillibacterium sp.]|nr:signal peptidase I [Gorillibacterium sp.]
MESEENIQPSSTAKSEVWEWSKAIIIAIVLVVLIRMFVFKPFIVDGPSMQPNFHTGERLIVSEWIYHLRHPQRGEVVVFHAPEGRDFIKRVVALSGETIAIKEGHLYVNGTILDEPYIQAAIDEYKQINGLEYNTDFNEETVPTGTVFVMGDNRVDSKDSRMIGAVAYDKIIGRADIVFWPINKISIVNHKK